MKALKLILVVVILNSQVLIMNCFAGGAGLSGGVTLIRPISAKAAAMAEAYSAVSGEVTSMLYNPAGIASLEKLDVVTMYQRGLDEDNFASIAFAKNVAFCVLGAGVQYYDTGKIELFDLQGNELSKIGQRDTVANISAAMLIPNTSFAVGVTFKGISSEIFGEKATAFAADIGAQYQGKVNVGLALQNFGTDLTYVDKGDTLPQTIRAGVQYAKKIEKNTITAAVDIPYLLNEEEALGLIGVEYQYDNLIAIRAGYRINLSDSSRNNDEQAVTAGVGFIKGDYTLDYAIGLTDNLSNPHYISIRMKF